MSALRRLHAAEAGASLPELLVGALVGALIMGAVVSAIYTTNDLRMRADDRSQFAGDLSVTSLAFDRDASMATTTAPARSQTSSTSCATAIDLGLLEGGASVRYRTVASGSLGPLWLQRLSGAGTRTMMRNVSSCSWQAVQDGSGRLTVRVALVLVGGSGESTSQTLRAAPRLW
jgi:hypothetical protein